MFLGVALTALLELYHSVSTALTHRPTICRTFGARREKFWGSAFEKSRIREFEKAGASLLTITTIPNATQVAIILFFSLIQKEIL